VGKINVTDFDFLEKDNEESHLGQGYFLD